jgi:hypothetical protein
MLAVRYGMRGSKKSITRAANLNDKMQETERIEARAHPSMDT